MSRFGLSLVACALIACAPIACAPSDAGDEDDGASPTSSEDEIRVDTSTPEARRQYDANATFAHDYVARCSTSVADPSSIRPRVLLTGFGRFLTIANNATGRIISTLVPAARYPETRPPPPGQVDEPEPQLSVAQSTIDLDGIGAVDVCAMILPVSWDLAAILIAKEVEAFQPTFVMMNGVAGSRQPLWIELGATNRASKTVDGSNQLQPAVRPGDDAVKIIDRAPAHEDKQGNVLSWSPVLRAAIEAVERLGDQRDGESRFGDVLTGARLAGYPRSSNTYLCNNVTYVTGWLMSHPNREARLLRASKKVKDAINDVRIKLETDFSKTPRVFVHWPSELADKHHAAAAEVMKQMIAAQLGSMNEATVGDNELADPRLRGGDFF